MEKLNLENTDVRRLLADYGECVCALEEAESYMRDLWAAISVVRSTSQTFVTGLALFLDGHK